MPKQYSKPFHEVFGLSLEQKKRVQRLVNFAKYQSNLKDVEKVSKSNQKDINDLQKYIKMLESQPEPNKQLIYRTKKNIEMKQAMKNEADSEIKRLKKYSVKDKPENITQEILDTLGPSTTKIVTRIRANFITLPKNASKNDSDRFNNQGRCYAERSGIRASTEAINHSIFLYRGARNKVSGREPFAEFKSLKPWQGFARIQILGKGGSTITLVEAVETFIVTLEYISRLAKPDEKIINKWVNDYLRNATFNLVGDVTIRFVVYQKTKAQYAAGTDSSGKRLYRFRNEQRPYSFPGQEPIVIKINGGV